MVPGGPCGHRENPQRSQYVITSRLAGHKVPIEPERFWSTALKTLPEHLVSFSLYLPNFSLWKVQSLCPASVRKEG